MYKTTVMRYGKGACRSMDIYLLSQKFQTGTSASSLCDTHIYFTYATVVCLAHYQIKLEMVLHFSRVFSQYLSLHTTNIQTQVLTDWTCCITTDISHGKGNDYTSHFLPLARSHHPAIRPSWQSDTMARNFNCLEVEWSGPNYDWWDAVISWLHMVLVTITLNCLVIGKVK